MSDELNFDSNFFAVLDEEDARVAAAAKAGGCPACAGRLDRANFPRKPRGGEIGGAGEELRWRRSLCCSREVCRKRLTPPSLVFLGRRVYLAVTVVMATWRACAMAAEPAVAPPRRTLRRWQAWFAALPATPRFAAVRARMSPPLEPGESMPGALLARVLPGRTLGAAVTVVLRLVAPLVTASVPGRA